jgi:hypothetical protein
MYTGASITITNSCLDFLLPPCPVAPTQLKGIAAGLTVQGIRTTKYSFCADDGKVVDIILHNVFFMSRKDQYSCCVLETLQRIHAIPPMVLIPLSLNGSRT